MSLVAGTRLGPYEIQSAIGAGGMGEVYRARDTRLDRTVAIKVLPTELSTDPERRARFEREAKTIAGLSHPHICTLHDVGEHDGMTYLVMEHIHGETLADRLLRGPVPLRQALDIAAQTAEALDAAHKHGIIHRDLKPGNVMLTDGVAGRSGVPSAKLLDFGLAKLAAHGERKALATEASAPTLTRPVTTRGHIVGTLQYMAPEQLEGKEADARTDLWALGALLHEMVTGKRAFEADSDVGLIGAILSTEPPSLSAIHPLTSPSLDRLVKKCLAKHPDDRWDSARDVADELRWIAQVGSETAPAPRSRGIWLRRLGLASTFVIAAGLAIAGAFRWFQSAPAPAPAVRRVTVTLPADVDLYLGTAPGALLLPDDSGAIFSGIRAGIRQLFVRPLDGFDAAPVKSAAAVPATTFFLSSDGRSVAIASSGGGLKRITLADGLVELVAPEVDGRLGGAWGSNGRVVFALDGELWQVAAGGGVPRRLTRRDAGRGELLHGWPTPVGDGSVVLFTVVADSGRANEHIEAVDVTTGERRVVVEAGRFPLYTSSGHLVFYRDRALLALPFDEERLLATGQPVRVLEDVQVDMYGSPLAALSAAGSLVYVAKGTNLTRLFWASRDGSERQAFDSSGVYTFPSVSPDGRRIAVAEGGDLCVLDTARAAMTRLSLGASAANSWPTWTPDGNRLLFRTMTGLQSVDADGSGRSVAIAGTSVLDYPTSVSPDGSTLTFVRQRPDTSGDIYLASLRGEPNLRPFLNSAAYEGGGQFSPDGRWLAYASNESGQMEVYVRPFPAGDRKWLVSSGGGTQPRWTKNGGELVFRSGNKLIAVAVSTTGELTLAPPKVLFERPYAFGVGLTAANYDVSPDGQRFIMIKPEAGSTGLSLVLNWVEELKAKVPAGGAK